MTHALDRDMTDRIKEEIKTSLLRTVAGSAAASGTD
jgi:hypothetical protein